MIQFFFENLFIRIQSDFDVEMHIHVTEIHFYVLNAFRQLTGNLKKNRKETQQKKKFRSNLIASDIFSMRDQTQRGNVVKKNIYISFKLISLGVRNE